MTVYFGGMRTVPLAVALWAIMAAPAMAMRCGTHLVSQGDAQAHVLRRCGEPTDMSLRIEEETFLQNVGGATFRQTRTVTVESWVYNFGPTRAMERVEFRDGVVVRIETLGRGYRVNDAGARIRGVHLRDTRGQVLAKWGEPTGRERRRETSSVYVPSGRVAVGATRVVEVEAWTYDRGPRRFVRRVVFEDGLVVRIETLGRGTRRSRSRAAYGQFVPPSGGVSPPSSPSLTLSLRRSTTDAMNRTAKREARMNMAGSSWPER